jgi:anaerobic magnesium-protoporphyrin IX monomethyl ester cyclase
LKVTFVQPYYSNVWEALGIAYIVAFCKKNYDFFANFYQAKFDSDEKIIDGSTHSDIVAFSCTTPSFYHSLKLAASIKEINKKIFTVFGGFHVSAVKEKALRYSQVDQIVLGEGEKAFLEILSGNTDSVVYGKKLPFSELPWPDRDVILNHRTIDLCENMNGLRTTSFQANRGCPFRCSFCSERFVSGDYHKVFNPIRSRDVHDLCDEIQFVIGKYRLNYFKFVDATFDASPQYVIDFCKEKIKRKITTEWECNIHASLSNEEMFYWLKLANCNQVDIGCESGSNSILRDIGKGLNVTTIKKVFGWAKEYGLKRRAFFLIGVPTETRTDIELTEKLIDEIIPDVVGFTMLCPYPGTEFYDESKFGFGRVDWSKADEYNNDFWETPYFTNKELKNMQRILTEKYRDKLCERQRKFD